MNDPDISAIGKKISTLFLPLILICCFGFQCSCLGQSRGSRTVAVIHYSTSDMGWYLGMGEGAPIVTVMVNGHPARFVFDTGTAGILVTEQFVQHVHWLEAREAEMEPGIEMPQDSLGTQPMMIQAGPLKFTEGIRTVKDLDLSGLVRAHVDGILGMSAIENAAVLISPTRETLTFYLPGSLTQKERGSIGMGQAVAVPLKRTSDQLLSVAATLTEKGNLASEDLVVDTGAKDTIVSEDSFKALGGTVLSSETLETVWGNEAETTFTIDQAGLGSLTLNAPVLNYASSRAYQAPVVLGRDILSKYRVLIDTPAMMMYLLPVVGPASRETGLP